MLYDAAEQDYEAAKILAQNALLPQCLFYLEQSYEKCTKAILAYTEIELRKRDATEVEGELRSKKLGHNNRASTHDLWWHLLDEDKKRREKDGTMTSTEIETALNFVERVSNTKQEYHVSRYHEMIAAYHKSYQIIKAEPRVKDNVSRMHGLWIFLPRCFERIDSVSRYPLGEYNYTNLKTLNQNIIRDSCNKLLDMVKEYLDYTPEMLRLLDQKLIPYFANGNSTTENNT